MEPPRPVSAEPEAEPLSRLLLHPILQDPYFLAAAGGLVVAFIFFSFVRSGPQAKRRGVPTVLLAGPVDGGKTALFASLAHDAYVPTHTTIAPSRTTFALPSPDGDGRNKTVQLVDLPGHPRLRDELTTHVASADAIVFVVDIVALVRNAPAIADLWPALTPRQLPPILTSLASAAARQPLGPARRLLLLAHKTDLLVRPAPPAAPSPPDLPPATVSTAHERLRTILTREMDRLKSARGGAGGRIEGMGRVATTGSWWSRLLGGGGGAGSAQGPQGETDEDEALVWGGKGPFRWDDVEGVEIAWAASGLGMPVGKGAEGKEGNGLDEVNEFLWDL